MTVCSISSSSPSSPLGARSVPRATRRMLARIEALVIEAGTKILSPASVLDPLMLSTINTTGNVPAPVLCARLGPLFMRLVQQQVVHNKISEVLIRDGHNSTSVIADNLAGALCGIASCGGLVAHILYRALPSYSTLLVLLKNPRKELLNSNHCILICGVTSTVSEDLYAQINTMTLAQFWDKVSEYVLCDPLLNVTSLAGDREKRRRLDDYLQGCKLTQIAAFDYHLRQEETAVNESYARAKRRSETILQLLPRISIENMEVLGSPITIPFAIKILNEFNAPWIIRALGPLFPQLSGVVWSHKVEQVDLRIFSQGKHSETIYRCLTQEWGVGKHVEIEAQKRFPRRAPSLLEWHTVAKHPTGAIGFRVALHPKQQIVEITNPIPLAFALLGIEILRKSFQKQCYPLVELIALYGEDLSDFLSPSLALTSTSQAGSIDS